MDWFVCGDFASISCGTWISFWSGTIGAFVAAVIGGLVALGVVRLTNGHQSKLAAEQREKAAIADLAAAADALMRRYDEGIPVIQDIVIQATAASDRWQMETDHAGLKLEIARWPHHIGALALDLHAGDFRNPEGGPSDEFKRLGGAVVELRELAMDWMRAPRAGREAAVKALRDKRVQTKSPNRTEPTAAS